MDYGLENGWQVLLSIAAALGLAAACGFRVFVPLLVVSIAGRAGLVGLSDGMTWLGSTPALVCLSLATALEIAGYYIPVVDNFLDTISTPASAVAGAVVASAVLVDVDPWLRWTLAIVAGAGLATAVQIPTVGARGTSTASTLGVANPVLSTGEAAGATFLSGLAVLVPILVPVVLLGGLGAVLWYFRRPAHTA